MCLATPGRVSEILSDVTVRVDLGGVSREVSTLLIDDVAVGDYLLVHVGHALSRIDPDEAEKTLALLAEVEADYARVLDVGPSPEAAE